MKLQRFMQAPAQTCKPEETLAFAARRMEIHNVGSLVVADDTQHIVGIITDRDLALALAHGKGADTPVGEVMTEDVVTVSEDTDIDDAAAAMDSRGVRRLPVADVEGHAVGMIGLDDLYKYLSEEAITLAGAVRAQGSPPA